EVAVVGAAKPLGDPPERPLQFGPAGLVRAPCAEQANGVAPGPEREAWLHVTVDERLLRLGLPSQEDRSEILEFAHDRHLVRARFATERDPTDVGRQRPRPRAAIRFRG